MKTHGYMETRFMRVDTEDLGKIKDLSIKFGQLPFGKKRKCLMLFLCCSTYQI